MKKYRRVPMDLPDLIVNQNPEVKTSGKNYGSVPDGTVLN